jgi:hypothetical protein
MKSKPRRGGIIASAIVLLLVARPAVATDSEIQDLRNAVREMQKTIEVLNRKIDRLEEEKTAAGRQPEPLSPIAPAIVKAKPAAPASAAPALVVVPKPEPPQPESPAAAPTELAEGVAPEMVPPPPMPPASEQAAEGYAENVLASQGIGPQAPIDPSLRGFLRIPNTRAMIRFNAKPRVDFTYDPENTGDDNRFVTARIPVFGSPD